MTALDLISSALRLINVMASGETTPIDMASDSLMVLNDMIDSWNTERQSIFTTRIDDFPFVLGQQNYTLGTGGDLSLIKRVQPIYPAIMQSARVTGQVVLDAIIHPDGTIGDITVLRSTNDAFAQSAIAAVKQWRYSAPGFEGILTVNVNFTLNA